MTTARDVKPGYGGKSPLKPPVWTWEVPVYFFVGGLGGGAAVLGLAMLLFAKPPHLTRAALWLAAIASLLSGALLVMDLGRPARFLNMLRVFKWRSPMSVGAWLLSAFGAFAAGAAVLFEWNPAWAVIAAVPAAVSGSALATYTGVLIGATVVPAWGAHHRLLPVHFGVAGLGSAAATLLLLGGPSRPLDVLLVAAAVAETVLWMVIEVRRHGARDRALRVGASGATTRVAAVSSGPLTLVLRGCGFGSAAAVAFLAGALLSRFAWIAAGRASAGDPEAAFGASAPKHGLREP